jgi:CRP/FNR family cyclic AMP-dependent transcriptional regulator
VHHHASQTMQLLRPFERVRIEALATLLDGAREERVPVRRTIMRRGEPADCLFLLLAGRLRVSVTSAEGREFAFRLIESPGIVGEVGVIDGGPRTADVVAASPARLVRIPARACHAAMRAHPDLADAMMRLLCERLRDTSRASESIATERLDVRLAHLLLRLARDYGRPHATGAIVLPMRLSQSDIGTMVAATRESVNKQLRQWRDTGIVGLDSGQIVLQMPSTLAALAE